MLSLYTLNDKGEPIPAKSIMDWAGRMEERFGEKFDTWQVARTPVGDSEISTVFLGIDHNFFGDGPPVLWETMIFGGTLDSFQKRCAGGREQAEAMHEEIVSTVMESLHLIRELAQDSDEGVA